MTTRKGTAYVREKVRLPIKECVILNLISTAITAFWTGMIAAGKTITTLDGTFLPIVSMCVIISLSASIPLLMSTGLKTSYFDKDGSEYVLRRF